MDSNVTSIEKEQRLRNFLAVEKFLMFVFLIVPFACYIANYSAYYIPNIAVYSSILAVFLFLVLGSSVRDDCNRNSVTLYFVSCLFVWISPIIFHFQMPSIKLLYELMYTCSFLMLCNESKLWIYDKFIKILAIILLLGIIEFLLSQIGVVNVIGKTVRPNSSNTNIYYQTFFNILPYYYATGLARFQSIAEEPGLVGTLCFFVLSTIDMRKYKIQSVIFGVAGILSMSMAFYMLIALWMLAKLKTTSLKVVLISLLVLSIPSCLFYDKINKMIVERVTEKSKDGTLDNRNSAEVEKLYNETYLSFPKFVSGIGNRTFESLKTGNSAGVKKNIVQYGAVMIFLAIVSFVRMFLKVRGSDYDSVIILLLFLVSLYQRFDLNLSTNTIVIFGSIFNNINFYYSHSE